LARQAVYKNTANCAHSGHLKLSRQNSTDVSIEESNLSATGSIDKAYRELCESIVVVLLRLTLPGVSGLSMEEILAHVLEFSEIGRVHLVVQ